MNDRDWYRDNLAEVIGWRRDFHRRPEIGFQEALTSRRIAELLESWGIKVHTGIGGTGVVGVLPGTGNQAIGLRADMDALPMTEATKVPYKSEHDGAFHGCGHDGHTAILLSVAKRLATEGRRSGTVNLIFQPAEETLRGGAAMIENGLFKRFPCDEIYALHNYPLLPVGTVAVRAGVVLAASDHFEIDIRGVGSHGATPHKAVDPVVVAGELIGQLQTIVARALDPTEAGVISVGTINGGTTRNVIPERVHLTGIIRSISDNGRELLHRRMTDICGGLGIGFGAAIECRIETDCPATFNHSAATTVVSEVARELLGSENVITDLDPVMAAEDFSFMLRERPGAYFLVGQKGKPCHHPEYDFDDDIIPTAGAMLLGIARRRAGAAI
jgi:hippurate hydrolase